MNVSNMPKKRNLILSFVIFIILITSLTFNVVKYHSERVIEVTTEKVVTIDNKEEVEKAKEKNKELNKEVQELGSELELINEENQELENKAKELNKIIETLLSCVSKKIGKYAFHNSSITSINIPNQINIIEDYAFFNSKLTSVSIPNSVKYIGENAFANTPLEEVTIFKETIFKENAFPKETKIIYLEKEGE